MTTGPLGVSGIPDNRNSTLANEVFQKEPISELYPQSSIYEEHQRRRVYHSPTVQSTIYSAVFTSQIPLFSLAYTWAWAAHPSRSPYSTPGLEPSLLIFSSPFSLALEGGEDEICIVMLAISHLFGVFTWNNPHKVSRTITHCSPCNFQSLVWDYV